MRNLETSRPAWLFFAPLAGLAFALNWLWEMVQLPVCKPSSEGLEGPWEVVRSRLKGMPISHMPDSARQA